MYHGSRKKLKQITPHPSNVINGEKAVFGTISKDWAIFFISHPTDSDIESGFIGSKPFILEQYPGAFNKLKISGYLYELDPKNFKSDKRLGLKNIEFISKKKENILSTKKISNVYNYIKRSGYFTMISFDDKVKLLHRFISKNNK